MTHQDADLLIIGAGIAGASAAFFTAQTGRTVTLIDAGIETASKVPTALINPVRGYQGKLMPRGLEGARFTFNLIQKLIANGHYIPYGQGLWRPAPDASVHTLWQQNLDSMPIPLPHRWQELAPPALNLRNVYQGVLYLPDSGWVNTESFLKALLLESRAQRIHQEIVNVDTASSSVQLSDGTRMIAKKLLWCGGAWGAAKFGKNTGLRPGSLLITDRQLGTEAVSYGLYAAPHGSASVIGPTTEPITGEYDYGPSPAAWIERTVDRARAMFASPFEVRSTWHGVRLETTILPGNLKHLTGFGSRGYLLAPMLAAEWAANSALSASSS